jgi:hypothetical protein
VARTIRWGRSASPNRRSRELRPALTTSSTAQRRSAAAALVGAAVMFVSGPHTGRAQSYVPIRAVLVDTLRPRSTEAASSKHSRLASREVVRGYLSPRGLPPVPGQFALTDSGLVFHSAEGAATKFPLVGPVRQAGGRQWRPSAVSLAYMDESSGRRVYVFRIDAGVFETDAPGALLDVAAHPEWLDSIGPTEWSVDQTLVNAADSIAVWATAREIAASAFADSLYSLFGRPEAPVGLIGHRGRLAGRLGEYIASRDSFALDPGRMNGRAQLRHAMAHELGHRWQSRARGQVATLWAGVTPIRDPKRYGYGDVSEHQAEAIAFAINFLQTTAAGAEPETAAITLLDQYELLVPGTRTMVRYFSLQPIYRQHPLRTLLTTGQ